MITEVSTSKSQWNLFISQQVYNGKPALVANPAYMEVFNLKPWSIKVVIELFSPFEPVYRQQGVLADMIGLNGHLGNFMCFKTNKVTA